VCSSDLMEAALVAEELLANFKPPAAA
jgi:hypothetical protein